MRFSRSTAATAAAALLFATTTNAQNMTSMNLTAPSGSVMTHVIQVSDANGSLAFFPSTLTASAGDLLQFQFWPKAHSVAQSTFDNPCQPMGNSSADSEGFWSGFMPVTAQDTTMPVFSVIVNDTKPIWAYCATGKHCQAGMALVVNPPEGKTLAMYQAAAKEVETTGIPSGGVEGGSAGNSTTGAGSGEGAAGGANSTVPVGTGGAGASAIPSSTASGTPDAGSAAAAGIMLPKGQAVAALVAVVVGALVVV